MVMVLYILLFFVVSFLILRKLTHNRNIFLASVFLLVTFAPIYGHGKNVLGEVPGLFFFLLSILCLFRLKDGEGRRFINIIVVGMSLGLSVAIKPIFILIAPAALITAVIYRKELLKNSRELILLVLSLCLPLVLWFFVQFQHDSLRSVLSFYSNPNSIDISSYVLLNIKRFFTELQPLYTLNLFFLWTISVLIRFKQKSKISPAEFLAFTTTFLVLVAYLRTEGFYRYFFIAEALCILFVVPAVVSFLGASRSRFAFLVFGILIVMQTYQTFFHSWVGTHYEGTRTALLESHIGSISSDKYVFFYQTPEAVLFIPHNNYSEYLEITSTLRVGEKELSLLSSGLPDMVVVPADLSQSKKEIFLNYHELESFDRYTILTKD